MHLFHFIIYSLLQIQSNQEAQKANADNHSLHYNDDYTTLFVFIYKLPMKGAKTMTKNKTLYINQKRAEYIQTLLSMTGKEIYDKYGLKRDETITETVVFENTAYEMDIKLVIPMDETETPWTEAVLFFNGWEVACSDVEDEFFGEWTLEADDHSFTVNIAKETDEHAK